MLLTVAVWIAYGSKGVSEFQAARRSENNQSGSKAADSFHDGRRPIPNILQIVSQHLDSIHMELKKSDPTTPEVLSRLVDRMIDVDPQRRPSAATLCGDATRALEAAERSLNSYYGATDHVPNKVQPLSPISPHALPLRYPSVPSQPRTRLAYTSSDLQTPLTPTTRGMPIQRNDSTRRAQSGTWTIEGASLEHRHMPETPTMIRPRPLPGPRHSVPALSETMSSPIRARGNSYIEDVVSEEPDEDDLDHALEDVQESRPGHVARRSDPSVPRDHMFHSPSPARQNPYLSVDDAAKYVDDAQKFWRSPKLLNAHYRDFIKGRDHV